MKKISSRTTFLFKRVFPALFFLFLASFAAMPLFAAHVAPSQVFVLAPLAVALIGFLVMRRYVWTLADEVYDLGDHLLVRKGGYEEKIELSNVMSVESTRHRNPPRVTLRLRHPGRLGSAVAFAPPVFFSFNPFAKHPVAEDLLVRVDQARLRRSA